MKKIIPILIYLFSAGLALLTTLVLPVGKSATFFASVAECFFGLSAFSFAILAFVYFINWASEDLW